MTDLVQHHVKYKEIHGVDEIVLLTKSEHAKLHLRLRKEGKCNVSAEELAEIANKAHHRTLKYKVTKMKSDAKYNQTEKGRAAHAKCEMQRQCLDFSESFGEHTSFRELVRYNFKTGSVYYTAGFCATSNYALPVIDIDIN